MIGSRAKQFTLRLVLRPAAVFPTQSAAQLQPEGTAWLLNLAAQPQPGDTAGTISNISTDLRFSSAFQQTFASWAVLATGKVADRQSLSLQQCAVDSTACSANIAVSRAARPYATDTIPQAETGEADALQQQKATHAPKHSKPSVDTLDPAGLLKRLNVMRFRETLAAEAESRPTISNDDFLALCRSTGTAATDEEAARICTVMADAGIVLRFADLVYLRPMDIAEYIVQALPGSQAEVQERLDALKQELRPMDLRKQQIDRTAHRWVSSLLWVGLASFVFQWVLFLRLTFWELSWDVMEPVCYFVSSAGGIAAYCYFLATHEDFGYAPWRSRIAQNLQEGGYARRGLDLRRYQMLQRDVHRLERFLKR